MTEELKPCPNELCRSTNIEHDKLADGMNYIICRNCGLNTPFYDTKEESADFWNTRAAQPFMQEWLPIESAPRDGTCILAYSPCASEPKIFIAGCVECDDGATDWIDPWTESVVDAEITHWMPLPTPPNFNC